MTEAPLIYRLYTQPHLYELARAVGYDGKTDAEMRPLVKKLIAVHGADKLAEALQELTDMERDTNRTVLLPHVRKMCFQLLGPAPEHPRHDEIRYGPILYSEDERQEWRQRFAAEKQAKEVKEQTAAGSATPAKPAKKSRRKGRRHQAQEGAAEVEGSQETPEGEEWQQRVEEQAKAHAKRMREPG